MEKIKVFFDKFKGYILTAALALLSAAEMCGGFINAAFGGTLVIQGVEVLPVVTLTCAVVVGALSNGYTKEQLEKIKVLFSKANTNELVADFIKKAIKEKTAELAQLNKSLTTLEHELANYKSEHEKHTNNLLAKKEMYAMVPQLATAEDVKNAESAAAECKNRITAKEVEIVKAKEDVESVTKMIGELKNKLQGKA